LMIPSLLKYLNGRRSFSIASVALMILLIPFLALYIVSPKFTVASIESQFAKGSTATLWAMIDGNFQTGGFGPLVERLDPAAASRTFRKLPVISPTLLLIVFGAAGSFLFFKARLDRPHRFLSFYGLTLVIFFLWSPAWSPQWILHLIPIALLVLPYSPGLLIVTTLILVNLLEWPLLLSRGLFYTYPLTISLRLIIMILLGLSFYQASKEASGLQDSHPKEFFGN